ncbi:flagellin [Oryzifoliimicrobium ureilyticus]|uniref:flagellin N-terminal helical domain-containing protein n=1 Tax=Oryzifoliimicrobium ureilyticus TaxID=3113724 RepID=UPI00307608A5
MSIYRREAVDAALYVLRDVNRNLLTTQRQVATGLRVERASDNGAYWAISTKLKTDQKAQSAIQDALGLAGATMDTAYSAVAESTDLVSEIKAKLVAATETGVDKTKINDELTQLKDQLRSVVSSATFNGDNWVQLKDGDNPAKPREIPASFIRMADGTVRVDKLSYQVDISPSGTTTSKDARYLVDDRPDQSGQNGVFTSVHFATETGASQNYVLVKTAGDSTGQVEIALTENTSQDQVKEMVRVVDAMLNQMTTVGSAFGALEKRISLQSDFSKSINDNYSTSISRMIDANMEEEGSRLKALQTQQQLALQSLSIANAAYDTVRQLFQNI